MRAIAIAGHRLRGATSRSIRRVRAATDRFHGAGRWPVRALRGFGVVEIVPRLIDLADADVLVEGEIVAHEVLKDHADRLAHRCELVLAQIDAVEENATFGRVIESGEQFRERRLAGAVLTH